MTLVIQCPRCGKRQRYQPRPGLLKGRKKRCVYCDYGIAVTNHIVRREQ